jgi:hypothetical protein
MSLEDVLVTTASRSVSVATANHSSGRTGTLGESPPLISVVATVLCAVFGMAE